MYISSSVGVGGKNIKNDVLFIQDLLNLIAESDFKMPSLIVDGKFGEKTKKSIYLFQKNHVKLTTPDSRIDPNGRTEKTLISEALVIDKDYIAEIKKKYSRKKANPAISGVGPRNIVYRVNAKKVLSSYTENIVKLAMAYAGINKCDISSTLRTFEDQSRIMYGNCEAFPSATSVDSLRTARGWGYAAAGREVETVYFANKKNDEKATRAAMKTRIEELYGKGQKVSLHCVSAADFNKKNVLDIPYSSVIASKKKDFEIALMGMTREIKNRRYGTPVKGEIYIDRLIVEDKCWHLEIPQTNKTLPNQNKPAVLIKRSSRKNLSGPKKLARDYFWTFLDDWF